MGRADAAQASYEAALKLNPDDVDASEKRKALVAGEKSLRVVLLDLFRIRGLRPANERPGTRLLVGRSVAGAA